MFEEKLQFPTKPLTLVSGKTVDEYIIPYENKQQVLNSMYPFEGVPHLTDMRIDIHCGKHFLVGEFRVTRERNINYLVSPYYPESSGTVIDWAGEWFPEQKVTRKPRRK